MITIPDVKPDLLKLLETDFGTTVAQSIWKKIVAHQNFLNTHLPIGLIMFFFSTQLKNGIEFPGGQYVDSPDSKWKFCDGSVIYNSLSPLYGQAVPDLRGRFLKHDNNVVGAVGGVTSINFAHVHILSYNEVADNSNERSSEGDEQYWRVNHTHGTYLDLQNFQNIVPQYAELQPYMRVA